MENDPFPNNSKGVLTVAVFAAVGIGTILLPDEWFLPALGTIVGALAIYATTRWLNSRHDPQTADRPPRDP